MNFNVPADAPNYSRWPFRVTFIINHNCIYWIAGNHLAAAEWFNCLIQLHVLSNHFVMGVKWRDDGNVEHTKFGVVKWPNVPMNRIENWAKARQSDKRRRRKKKIATKEILFTSACRHMPTIFQAIYPKAMNIACTYSASITSVRHNIEQCKTLNTVPWTRNSFAKRCHNHKKFKIDLKVTGCAWAWACASGVVWLATLKLTSFSLFALLHFHLLVFIKTLSLVLHWNHLIFWVCALNACDSPHSLHLQRENCIVIQWNENPFYHIYVHFEYNFDSENSYDAARSTLSPLFACIHAICGKVGVAYDRLLLWFRRHWSGWEMVFAIKWCSKIDSSRTQ